MIEGARIRAWIATTTTTGFAVFGVARDEQGSEYQWLHDDGYDTFGLAEADAAVLSKATADPDLVGFIARRVINVR